MNLRQSDEFMADVEAIFAHYFETAGLEIAREYRHAVEDRCQFLSANPEIGPMCRFKHPDLKRLRFFLLSSPFDKHLLFYEVSGPDVVMRRTMHGHRNLRRRLLEPPEPS